MKIVVLIAAAVMGALATIAVPPTFSAARAIFDSGRQRNHAGMTSEEPGVHASAIGSKPVTLAPPASLKLDLGRAFEAQAETQTQQNDRRMREMQAYTRNPGQLVGARPN